MPSERSTYLEMSWGVSRGRETYGYNIARLIDTSTGKRYRCLGGGYDMQGTVFGEWLQNTHQDALLAIRCDAHQFRDRTGDRKTNERGHYGMTFVPNGHRYDTGEGPTPAVYLDGACGLESMLRIAEATGLKVKRVSNRRGHLTGLIVNSPDATVTIHRGYSVPEAVVDGDVTYHRTESETVVCEDVTDAVRAITGAGCLEYSASEFQAHGWWTAEDHTSDYATGEMCTVSAHVAGFTLTDVRAIYTQVSRS